MKLSIITINRNNASGLHKTLESVVSQTFTDYEYIIIDGASSDGSVDIIKQYANKITYWVSEPDKGIYNAMNKGILNATGEYCLFLNSGDSLHTYNVLDEIFRKEINSKIILGDVNKIQVNEISEIEKPLLYYKKNNDEDLTLFEMFHGFLNHQASFIKRDLFEDFGLYDEKYKIASDWKFFLQVIGIMNVSVSYIDIVISDYDMTGLSSSNEELLLCERNMILEEIFSKRIIEDYMFFYSLKWKYNNLQKKYDYLFYFKSVLFLTRFINKLVRLLKLRKSDKLLSI